MALARFQSMSLRAKLLRLALRLFKHRGKRRVPDIETTRRRLRLLEAFVPGAPAGTRNQTLDADGVNAVNIVPPQARDDACILHFHGGGYMIGSAPLYRDFTWRIGAAACSSVLYFDYRLAPEHPFPAALDDAVTVYRWLAKRIAPKRIAVVGDSAGGGLAFGTLYRLRDEGLPLPAAAVVDAWRAEGIPGYLSDTAGRYLCNESFYLACATADRLGLNTVVGFIHVPLLPDQVTRPESQPSMGFDLLLRAATIALATTVASLRLPASSQENRS